MAVSRAFAPFHSFYSLSTLENITNCENEFKKIRALRAAGTSSVAEPSSARTISPILVRSVVAAPSSAARCLAVGGAVTWIACSDLRICSVAARASVARLPSQLWSASSLCARQYVFRHEWQRMGTSSRRRHPAGAWIVLSEHADGEGRGLRRIRGQHRKSLDETRPQVPSDRRNPWAFAVGMLRYLFKGAQPTSSRPMFWSTRAWRIPRGCVHPPAAARLGRNESSSEGRGLPSRRPSRPV